MKWQYTNLSDDYPQRDDVCLVETSDDYRLMWYNTKSQWWYDYDSCEPYAKNTAKFKWIYIDDILENIE